MYEEFEVVCADIAIHKLKEMWLFLISCILTKILYFNFENIIIQGIYHFVFSCRKYLIASLYLNVQSIGINTNIYYTFLLKYYRAILYLNIQNIGIDTKIYYTSYLEDIR